MGMLASCARHEAGYPNGTRPGDRFGFNGNAPDGCGRSRRRGRCADDRDRDRHRLRHRRSLACRIPERSRAQRCPSDPSTFLGRPRAGRRTRSRSCLEYCREGRRRRGWQNGSSVSAFRHVERESAPAFDSTTALTYAALHVAVVFASRRARARVGPCAGARRLRDVRARRRPLVGVWRRGAGGRGVDARSASSRAVLGVHLLFRRGRTRRVDRMVDARRWRRRRDPVAADTARAPHVAAASDAC